MIPVTSKVLNPLSRTHVVVATRGNDLGTALQYAAASKIWRLKALYPEDQILFITTQEKTKELGMTLLSEMGFSTIVSRVSFLSITALMSELSLYSKIASLHFFSHGSPVSVFLDRIGKDTDLRWMTEAPESKKLTGRFTKDAYAIFYGCNSGHAHAPYLMKVWKIPVAGALTGVHLEKLSADNKFYWADKKSQGVRSRCHSTDCYRFRPDNAVYQGLWGTFQQGLPLFKFFCPNSLDEQCLAAMAASTASNVSVENKGARMSLQTYARAVQEWMCPSGQVGSSLQSECINALSKINLSTKNRSYTPFKGISSMCTFSSCYAEPACLNPSVRVCAKELPPPLPSTSFVDEYLSYLRAYPYLKNWTHHSANVTR